MASPSIIALLMLVGISVCRACSYIEGWTPPTITEKVLYADVVLYGRILQTFPHEHYSTAYTAEMEVYCFLKGGTGRERIVNLTGAGHEPGLCHASELLVGHIYIVLTNELSERLRVSNQEINNTNDNVAEVAKACELQPVYPKGVDAASVSADKRCVLSQPSSSDCTNLEQIQAKKKISSNRPQFRVQHSGQGGLEVPSVLLPCFIVLLVLGRLFSC